ncbi:MAG: CoA transferase [Myxococcales bacterium]|nr:MAG: CoA transferase [Myxococcales bacterium]
MSQPMTGIRILEVAEHAFVPTAGAILSDWGAEVIKVEHAERGDAMRGLGQTGVMTLGGSVHVLNEHANRGKRSIGIDLARSEGREVLYKLAATADVFLTNKLPTVLERLEIDVEHIRAHNPEIIYVRGTAFGPVGPDMNRGGYDMTAFWCRAGCAEGSPVPGMGFIVPQPAPAYGDSLGGMTIAGGIAGALLKRERTGEPSVVDVSLLATGVWAMGAAVALGLQTGEPWNPLSGAKGGGPKNPLTGIYKTSDDRFISVVMLQAFKYWPDFCEHIGRPELATNERFDTHEKLAENAAVAREIINEVIAGGTLAEWTERFSTLQGQWAPVQNSVEVAADPQVRENGYIAKTATADGTAFELAASPVQFDEQPTGTNRAPTFNEHGDELLRELGLDMDQILELKAAGAVT